MSPTPEGHRIGVPRRTFAAFALTLLLLAACSRDRDEVPRPDTTPPAKVTDLAARALSDSTILLTWTAAGDDGMDGTAERYDFRYNSEPFPAQGHFPVSFPEVPGTPPPAPGGTPETLLVGGLTYSTTYHFGMRVLDEMENLSPLSNVASARTSDTLVVIPPDTTPPAMIADLAVERLDLRFFRFTWTAVGDDGMDGQSVAYDMRWSLEPLTEENWEMATPVEDLPKPRLPGRSETFEAVFPTGTDDRHVALRAVDDEGNRSPLHALLLIPGLTPRTWYVNIEGTGDAPTIQAALDMAGPGDEVIVGPGLYRVNLKTPPWNLSLRSTDGREATILEPENDQEPILEMMGSESTEWTVSGLTLQKGRGSRGSAIRTDKGFLSLLRSRVVENYSPLNAIAVINSGDRAPSRIPVIAENVFENNHCEGSGGALGLGVRFQYRVEGNVFRGNRTGFDGGGTFIGLGRTGLVTVIANWFEDNHAGDHGGGLFLGSLSSRAQIAGNVFIRNRADGLDLGETGSGGGLNLTQTSGSIIGNTFLDNQGWTESGDGGGAIELEYISRVHLTEGLEIRDNIIAGSRGGAILVNAIDSLVRLGRNLMWDNGPIETVNLSGGVPVGWGAELIRADPLFCSPTTGDLQVSARSPAIIGKEVMGAFREPGCP
jgi:hypothetical protein